MRIASLDLGSKPLLLAPMEDVSDAPFRLLCKQFGAALVYTEFISADAVIRDIPSTLKKMQISQEERPVAIQIYGRDVDSMRRAALKVASLEPDLLDLNFGCPVKRVAGKGAGSGLLSNMPLLLEITREVVQAVSCPVTVKTRLGSDHNHIVIHELAPELQACGIAALTIHGRTRSDMYRGEALWEPIAQVKRDSRISIPIIGNGDITTPEQAREAFDLYGVDAVMVGRAAIGQPWIFSQMKAAIEQRPIPTLSPLEQLDILRYIVRNNIKKLDERRGILHSRRHLAASPVFKGIPHFRPLRIAMLQAATEVELLQVLERIEKLL